MKPGNSLVLHEYYLVLLLITPPPTLVVDKVILLFQQILLKQFCRKHLFHPFFALPCEIVKPLSKKFGCSCWATAVIIVVVVVVALMSKVRCNVSCFVDFTYLSFFPLFLFSVRLQLHPIFAQVWFVLTCFFQCLLCISSS